MIMRFMEVDPAEVLGSAALPSKLGNDERIRFGSVLDESIADSGSYRTALQTDSTLTAREMRCDETPLNISIWLLQHGIKLPRE
jgi:hypothetical protein